MTSRLSPLVISGVAACAMVFLPHAALAQSPTTTRLLILQAEERRAPTSADLNVIRVNARSSNTDTARVAIRALGRLERVSLIPDIQPGLRHALPEVRAEAANALAQAAQGWRAATAAAVVGATSTIGSVQASLIARLNVEDDGSVRGALCEALARLPYKTSADAARAEAAIVALGAHTAALADRLGVAKALETFVRVQGSVQRAGDDTLTLLQQLARTESAPAGLDLLRDARVRRLAVEALSTADAMDDSAVERAAEDADAQVRRLAMRAIGLSGHASHKLRDGLVDPSPLVRIEALRSLRIRGGDTVCPAAVKAAADVDMNTALVAIDQLAVCGSSTDGVVTLARIVAETDDLGVVRGWHRQAHAMVALATAAPDQARSILPTYVSARIWQVRAYAARAAAQLKERTVLETLAHDTDDRVANVSLGALSLPSRQHPAAKPGGAISIDAAEVRRLAAPRARIVVRDVGTIELALLTTEAPGTVIRFARLAEQGYYNGLSFDRFSPNAIVQGGDNGASGAGISSREAGAWPHVRGSIGVAEPDTSEAEFFINLVDNPRFDHQYTVFGQVLNGSDVVERLLEGDVIASITIVP